MNENKNRNADAPDSRRQPLLDRLVSYGRSDAYPFHMPGHKRQAELGITSFPNPFSVDITEIDGFDNLHHAEGILRDSMDRAASIYGSDRTYYMVNGSTGGILSAICGLTSPGGRMIMARNSHKAAYHAVLLNQLDPVYVYPDFVTDYGIQGGIAPEKIEELLRAESCGGQCDGRPEAHDGKHSRGIQAVFITSPTYEGMVSDVRAIAGIAHRYGVPLIVDEAHGAHFPFSGRFPESALDCGADVVIQSLHKTLPSLTQTAVLHIKSSLIEPQCVERYLSVFQSSSPSYVFLASMENCISYMDREGRRRMESFAEQLNCFMEWGTKLQWLRLVDDQVCGRFHVWGRDASKIVVSMENCGMTGTAAADLLRSRFHLEAEMACDSYVILMTSLMDTEEGFGRLEEALSYLDDVAPGGMISPGRDGAAKENQAGGSQAGPERKRTYTWLPETYKSRRISDAWRHRMRMVLTAEAAGTVSGGFITVYPPGVPMIVPGERITEEAVALIRENQELGLTVEGITEDGRLAVLDEE